MLMRTALVPIFIASLLQRRLATSLSLLAIALGVALGLAVQLIQGSALDEFSRGMRLLAGEADLQVLGPRGGFDEETYVTLALRAEIAEASPVLEIEASLPGRAQTLRIFGADVFRTAYVLSALLPVAQPAPGETADRLVALRPDQLFLSAAARTALGLRPGDLLQVQSGVRQESLRIAGSVPAAGTGQRYAVMDIAAAQHRFDQVGRLSRIDLRVADGLEREEVAQRLRALLPAGVQIVAPEAAESQATGLSRAYRVNLAMLAAIALLTGAFLVFSTQLLSVVRRRQEFAFLRALGLDRSMLMRGLLAEGAAIGLLGGALGVALGYALTALAFALIGADLGAGYFQGVTPQVRFQPVASVAYLTLGVVAGLVGALLPAREAARMIPARALRAGDEVEILQARTHGWAALMCFGLAALACVLPPLHGVPVFGYVAVLSILAGAVLLLPGTTRWAMRALAVRRNVVTRLAHARLAAAPGQVVVAGAGVVASVALAVAMAVMVHSFRISVDDWLETMLPADLYVRASTASASGYLDADAAVRVGSVPGVAGVSEIRYETLRMSAEHFPVTLIARPLEQGWGLPLVGDSDPDPARRTPDGDRPPAWISEAMADLFALRRGDELTLPLAGHSHVFRVAGVWRDYARQHGAVAIELETYRELSADRRSNDLALTLAPGARAEEVAAAVGALFAPGVIEIKSAGTIRAISLAIFDRTFLVTWLMEAVAILIGLFGIATTFAALSISRRKEFGMLRHLGMLRREIGALLGREGALTALIGVALGTGAGGAIGWVLIEVINRQSFHWSMEMHVPAALLAGFGAALIGLAALAARVSGYHAMRGTAVQAVREDW